MFNMFLRNWNDFSTASEGIISAPISTVALKRPGDEDQ